MAYTMNMPVELMPGNETLLEQEVTIPNFLTISTWSAALSLPLETTITATLSTLLFSLTKKNQMMYMALNLASNKLFDGKS